MPSDYNYMFGTKIGPNHRWFAWYPVRLWYGKLVWLRYVRRQRIVKKPGLLGGDWAFWSYDDESRP